MGEKLHPLAFSFSPPLPVILLRKRHQASRAHLVLRSRIVSRVGSRIGSRIGRIRSRSMRGRLSHCGSGFVHFALGVVDRLLSDRGERKRGGRGNGRALSISPRAARVVRRTVPGAHDHPWRVFGARRHLDPAAQKPGPAARSWDPFTVDPRIGARGLLGHQLGAAGRRGRSDEGERVRALLHVGRMREGLAAGTEAQRSDDDEICASQHDLS
jgi:hypothetical protein